LIVLALQKKPSQGKKLNKRLVFGLLLLFLIIFGAAGSLAYQDYQLKWKLANKDPQPPSPPKPTVKPTVTLTPDLTDDWLTYKSQDNSFSFKYPPNLKGLIPNKQFNVSAKSKQEIIEEYEKYKETGCPGICGKLAQNPALLQKQFEILSKVNNLSDCSLSASNKKEVKEDFILFTGGAGNKITIEGIKTNSGKCGLKIIGFYGFDVSMTNIHYKAGFFVKDKIIKLNFDLFPYNAFEKVDEFWLNLGFDLTNLSCDESCGRKEADYFEKLNLNNDLEKEIEKTYDKIISSLQFSD